MVRLDQKNREQYAELVLDLLRAQKIKEFRQTFSELPSTVQVSIFLALDKNARKKCYTWLSPAEFAVVFEGMNIHDQQRYFQELSESYSSEMFNKVSTDDVARFLSRVDSRELDDILKKMEPHKAEKVSMLLSYADETAGAVMTEEFISISASDKVAHVIKKLRDEAPGKEFIYYNYVVDDSGKLISVVSLRDLITAPAEQLIKNIMSAHVVSVDDDMDQEEVAFLIQKYDFSAIPVVSKQNLLLGIVTVDDVIDILEDEATEDFGEISAAKGATDLTISAVAAAKKRSPWIITLMFLGLITGGVIGRFEETLEQVVLLAAFVPLIMDSAGNVGTQSLTVSVRGLALGIIEKGNLWKMIRREFNTGILIGITCMVLITLIIPVFYGNWVIGLIVGVSILCTLSMSAVVGSVIPLIINRLKFDPAIASGPFITTINDIIGLLIYFTIATALLDVI